MSHAKPQRREEYQRATQPETHPILGRIGRDAGDAMRGSMGHNPPQIAETGRVGKWFVWGV